MGGGFGGSGAGAALYAMLQATAQASGMNGGSAAVSPGEFTALDVLASASVRCAYFYKILHSRMALDPTCTCV
jgi:hypothetical protein